MCRHLINVQRPGIHQLRGAETAHSPPCLTSRGIRSSTLACKLAVTASHGSPLDDVDATMDEIRWVAARLYQHTPPSSSGQHTQGYNDSRTD